MALNYYSILSKATQGKGRSPSPGLYDEARALVARLRLGPDHTEENIAAQADALESAILRIEDDVAASYREETGTERLDSVLSSGPSWGRIAATVLAVIATIGLSASAYWYVIARGGRTARGPAKVCWSARAFISDGPAENASTLSMQAQRQIRRSGLWPRQSTIQGHLIN